MSNWISIVAGIMYIVMGGFVIIYKFFMVMLEPAIAYALGALLISYGIFRIGRAIYNLKNKDEE